MRLLALTFVLFLTGCSSREVVVESHISADLRQPETVRCLPGDTERDLARCTLMLRQALDRANDKLNTIDRILTSLGRV